MRFSLPELPDEHKTSDNPTADSNAGSYNALMAKLGRKTSADTAEAKSTPDGVSAAAVFTDDTDDGFEVDREQAEEAVEGMNPQLSGPCNAAAKLLSWIMVPLVMPVVSMAFLIWLTPLTKMTDADKTITMLVTIGFNTLLPMLLIGLLKLTGIVKDIGLNHRRERLIPYLITIAGLICTLVYLRSMGAPAWMWGTYLGAAIASLICCVVNFRWKISAHATAAAGVVATIAVIGTTGNAVHTLQWWLFGACLLSGLLGSARVFLRRHTDLQVVVGFINGFCSVYITSLLLN